MKKLLITAIVIVGAATMSFVLSDNGKAGFTNSPGEVTCTDSQCHDSYTLNSGNGSITISAPTMTNWQYVPGTVYPIQVTVAKPSVVLFGLGVEALKSDGSNGGTFTITNSSETQIKNAVVNGKVRANVVHKLNGGAGSNTKTFSFNWTAPATNSGPITFYAAGNASDNDGNETGDYIYTTTQVVTPFTVGLSTVVGPVSGISHYPNPAVDQFTTSFSLSEPATVAIELLDVNGRVSDKLYSGSVSSGSHEMAHQLIGSHAAGIYMVRVTVNGKPHVSRMVLQ